MRIPHRKASRACATYTPGCPTAGSVLTAAVSANTLAVGPLLFCEIDLRAPHRPVLPHQDALKPPCMHLARGTSWEADIHLSWVVLSFPSGHPICNHWRNPGAYRQDTMLGILSSQWIIAPHNHIITYHDNFRRASTPNLHPCCDAVSQPSSVHPTSHSRWRT